VHAVNANVSTAVNDNVSTAVNANVSTAVNDNVSTAVNDNVSTAVNDNVSTAVNANVSTAVNDNVSTAVNANVSTAVNANVSTAVNANVSTAVNANVNTAVFTEMFTLLQLGTSVKVPFYWAKNSAVPQKMITQYTPHYAFNNSILEISLCFMLVKQYCCASSDIYRHCINIKKYCRDKFVMHKVSDIACS
jgi:hypothetical protein